MIYDDGEPLPDKTTDTTREERAIEFERADGDPELGMRRWRLRAVTDDDKNDVSSCDYDATGADLIAALSSNAELRAEVLDALVPIQRGLVEVGMKRAEAAEAELERVYAMQLTFTAENKLNGKSLGRSLSGWTVRSLIESSYAHLAQPPPTPEPTQCADCQLSSELESSVTMRVEGLVLCNDCALTRQRYACPSKQPPAPPAPTSAQPKLPGGFGPDYVTRAELVEALDYLFGQLNVNPQATPRGRGLDREP
jgi:hypothetical protein